jgi:hypothetical protein
MIWIALDVPPPWAWLVIVGIFGVLSMVVFRFSFLAYHRRYFLDKALQLAFWRTIGWLVLNGGSFCIVFWLISKAFPTSGWLAYLVGCGVWGLLSNTLLAAGLQVLDRLLENW